MKAKTFEVRDRGTFIPVLAVRLDPGCEEDRYLIARAGYGPSAEQQGSYVMLMKLGENVKASSEPMDFNNGSRTLTVAHSHIIANWDRLGSGSVICVEHILGERDTPKTSESAEVL